MVGVSLATGGERRGKGEILELLVQEEGWKSFLDCQGGGESDASSIEKSEETDPLGQHKHTAIATTTCTKTKTIKTRMLAPVQLECPVTNCPGAEAQLKAQALDVG